METRSSRHHDGELFNGDKSSSSEGLLEPLSRAPSIDAHDVENLKRMHDVENLKRVHWSASTRSLTGLLRESSSDTDRPVETGAGGEFVKSIVYGGMDAIVTSFALVASVSGGGIGSAAVLVLGFANLIADGISMGFGDYLSTSTERTYAGNEQRIADWEMHNDLHAQAMNMVDVYESQGMLKSDAEEVVRIFSNYKDMLADQKLILQDGVLPPDDEEEAWKNGIVTFVSFICFGCTPLISFVVLSPFTDNVHVKFVAACVVTALALILLGIAKSRISGENWMTSALAVLSTGGFAAAAAYLISWSLKNLLGISDP